MLPIGSCVPCEQPPASWSPQREPLEGPAQVTQCEGEGKPGHRRLSHCCIELLAPNSPLNKEDSPSNFLGFLGTCSPWTWLSAPRLSQQHHPRSRKRGLTAGWWSPGGAQLAFKRLRPHASHREDCALLLGDLRAWPAHMRQRSGQAESLLPHSVPHKGSFYDHNPGA